MRRLKVKGGAYVIHRPEDTQVTHVEVTPEMLRVCPSEMVRRESAAIRQLHRSGFDVIGTQEVSPMMAGNRARRIYGARPGDYRFEPDTETT